MDRRTNRPTPQVTSGARSIYRPQPSSMPFRDDAYTLTPEGERLRAAAEEARLKAERDAITAWAMARNEVYEELLPIPESDDPMQDAAISAEITLRQRIHREEETEPRMKDPREWLRGPRISQTEASLRFALHLIREGHATADVQVSLSGRELTPTRKRPRFPVERFLEQHEAARRLKRRGKPDWRDRYALDGSSCALRLDNTRGACDVLAPVSPDARIIAYVAGGLTSPGRGSAEHSALRTLMGRALSHADVQPLDLLVVVIARNERSRKLARALRDMPRVMQAGLSICTVDRAGQVYGLPFPEAFGRTE